MSRRLPTTLVTLAWGLASLALTVAQPAEAQVSEGFAAMLAADFPRATAAFEREVASPEATWGSLVEAHRHLALLRHVEGDVARAHVHIEVALALDAEAAPPAAAGSQVAALFEEIRASDDAPSLRLSARILGPGGLGGMPLAQASVRGAPAALGLRVALGCSVEGVMLEPPAETVHGGSHSLRVELPQEGWRQARCTAKLTTDAGATVLTHQATPPSNPAASVSPERTEPGLERARAGSPSLLEPPEGSSSSASLLAPPEESSSNAGWIIGGVGLAAAITTVVIVLLAPPNRAELGAVEIIEP